MPADRNMPNRSPNTIAEETAPAQGAKSAKGTTSAVE